jgi:hypothetical protein
VHSSGNGRGSFASATTVTFPASDGRYTFAFGDVDGDSHLDVVVAHSGDAMSSDHSRVLVLRGDGKGAFKTSDPVMTSVPSGPRYVAIGDMNGDHLTFYKLSEPHKRLQTIGAANSQGSTEDLMTDCWAGSFLQTSTGDRLNRLALRPLIRNSSAGEEMDSFRAGLTIQAGPATGVG